MSFPKHSIYIQVSSIHLAHYFQRYHTFIISRNSFQLLVPDMSERQHSWWDLIKVWFILSSNNAGMPLSVLLPVVSQPPRTAPDTLMNKYLSTWFHTIIKFETAIYFNQNPKEKKKYLHWIKNIFFKTSMFIHYIKCLKEQLISPFLSDYPL